MYNGVLGGSMTGAITDTSNHIGHGNIHTDEETVEEIQDKC